MIKLWKETGFDKVLRNAWKKAKLDEAKELAQNNL